MRLYELLDQITYKLTNEDIAVWGLTFPILVGRSKLIFNACALHQRELDKDYGLFQYFNQKMFDNLLLYTSDASLHLLDLAFPKLRSRHSNLCSRVNEYRIRNSFECNICYERTNSTDSHYEAYHRNSVRDVLMMSHDLKWK